MLDVAVGDSICVDVPHARCDLLEKEAGLVFGQIFQLLALKVVEHVASFIELGYDVDAVSK